MHHFLDRFRNHSRHHFGERRHGRGRFAAGFGEGGGLGGRGFRSGRKLGSTDLQLLILALLEERPRYGYELIKELEERSGGFYSPSPGMIYPALTFLEEVGQATVAPEGAKKLYSLTDAGRARLAEGRAAVDSLLAQLSRIGHKMDRVRRAFEGEESPEEEAAARGGPEVREARRELRAALTERRRAAPEEQRRIAQILRRATEEIRGS